MENHRNNGVCYADRIFDATFFSGNPKDVQSQNKVGSCIPNPGNSLQNCVRAGGNNKCTECLRGHVLKKLGAHNHCDPSLECPFGCQSCEDSPGGHYKCGICDEYYIIRPGDFQCTEMDSYIDDEGNSNFSKIK